MKIVLHSYWRSSASHRVRIGLAWKGIAYQYAAINIVKAEQFADAYRDKNPMAQVPTLQITEDDGRTIAIAQSLPILEYLEERFGGAPLLPGDPYLRARTRMLCEIVNSGIQPFQNLATGAAVKKLGGDEGEWRKHFVTDGLVALERATREVAGAFSVGDAVSAADCFLIPQIASARRFGVDVARFELLEQIEQRCLALPAFQSAVPDLQPDAVK